MYLFDTALTFCNSFNSNETKNYGLNLDGCSSCEHTHIFIFNPILRFFFYIYILERNNMKD